MLIKNYLILATLFLISFYSKSHQDEIRYSEINYSPYIFEIESVACGAMYFVSIIEDDGRIWTSGPLVPDYFGEIGLVRVNIPRLFFKDNKVELKKEVHYPGCNADTFDLGNIKVSFVEVEIDSRPRNAELYLIPLLTWYKIGKPNLDDLIDKIRFEEFKINEGSTPIRIFLPEINYKALVLKDDLQGSAICKVIKSKPKNKLSINLK